MSHPIKDFPDSLVAIVTNPLRPGRNFFKHFLRQIGAPDLINATSQDCSQIYQPALALKRRRLTDTEQKKGIPPIRASEIANIPPDKAELVGDEIKIILEFPKG